MRKTLLFLSPLLLAPIVTSCAGLVVGAAAGLVISEQMLDNESYVIQLQEDVERVWKVSKRSMSSASTELIEVEEDTRTIRAQIDGGKVTVSVEAYDLDRTMLRVAAVKYGVTNGELANTVQRRIVRDLEGN